MTKSLLFAAFLSACSIPGISLGGHTSIPTSASPPAAASPVAPTETSAPAAPKPAQEEAPTTALEGGRDSVVTSAELLRVITDVDNAWEQMRNIGKADVAFLDRTVAGCKQPLDAAVARYGEYATVAGDTEQRALESMQKRCGDLDSRRKDYARRVRFQEKQQAHVEAENREFANAGLTGDRVTVARNGIFRGAGNTPMTLKQLAKAKFVFELGGSSFDGYVLHRLAFEGDKISDDREQGFVVKPGPEAYH